MGQTVTDSMNRLFELKIYLIDFDVNCEFLGHCFGNFSQNKPGTAYCMVCFSDVIFTHDIAAGTMI
jgi:hypothetical protein